MPLRNDFDPMRHGPIAIKCGRCMDIYCKPTAAFGVLQTGNVPRVVLYFEISAKNGNVNRFTLRGVLTFDANTIKFKITIMRVNKSLNHCRIHGTRLF